MSKYLTDTLPVNMCAEEGQVCSVPSGQTSRVFFGNPGPKGSGWVHKDGVKESIECTTASFGGSDPSPGYKKWCYVSEIAPNPYYCGDGAQLGSNCYLPNQQASIYYDAGGNIVLASDQKSQYVKCTGSTFGVGTNSGKCYVGDPSLPRTNPNFPTPKPSIEGEIKQNLIIIFSVIIALIVIVVIVAVVVKIKSDVNEGVGSFLNPQQKFKF